MAMTWDQVHAVMKGLDGVKERADPRGTRWCVDNRLVARRLDDERLLIRCAIDERERLLVKHPRTFEVTPAEEAHMKVIALLPTGDRRAIAHAIRAAWTMQRRG